MGSNSFCKGQTRVEFDLAVYFTRLTQNINQVALSISKQLCQQTQEYLYPSNAVWLEQFLLRFNRNSFLKLIHFHSFS